MDPSQRQGSCYMTVSTSDQAAASLATMRLEGFGRYRAGVQRVARPERLADLEEIASGKSLGTLIPRGAGKSYGDAALNSTGYVLSLERMNRMLGFSETRNVLTVEAGVTVLDVMRFAVSRGLTLAVAPGSSAITMGGCAAFDIHSKNHWIKGGFGDWVDAMRILLADGQVIECSRTADPDLFFATLGGMGLTGVILDLDVRLEPLYGTRVRNESQSFTGLNEMFERFGEWLPTASHCVSWYDLLNHSDPRGVVISSTYVAGEEPASAAVMDEWDRVSNPPVDLLALTFNHLSNRLFNVAFAARHRGRPIRTSSLRPFLFPWDSIPDWNRLYGRKGFVEYQICVPEKSAAVAFQTLLSRVIRDRDRFPVYFAASKRMRAGVGILTFPLDGYSMLLDFPVRDGIWSMFDEFDRIVADHGGRVFLAKDGRLSAEAFSRMYPNIGRFREVRDRVDPNGRFCSDMARRIGLVN